MKKATVNKVTLTLVMFALALSSEIMLAPANAATIQFYEFQVTADTASQQNPDINGINIVWQDNRNGNWDIYLYTLQGTFTPESQITSNTANQINPAISGNNIVYQDERSGNWDIYLYNISSNTETQITNNITNQENPDIDGNIIVWQDNRNGSIPQIYMFNLTSQTEKCISSSTPSSSDRQVMGNTNPVVSGNRVVYQRREIHTYEEYIQEDYREIIFCSLTTGGRTEIFWAETHKALGMANDADCPAIYGGRIVFESYDPHWPSIYIHYNEWNIHLHDIVTGARWDTTINQANQRNPDVNEDYIVYQDDRTGNWEIYLYNIGSNVESQVTNNTSTQHLPKVWGGRIVYMDNRNGNWDIYMTMVGYVVSGTLPPREGGPLGSSGSGGESENTWPNHPPSYVLPSSSPGSMPTPTPENVAPSESPLQSAPIGITVKVPAYTFLIPLLPFILGAAALVLAAITARQKSKRKSLRA